MTSDELNDPFLPKTFGRSVRAAWPQFSPFLSVVTVPYPRVWLEEGGTLIIPGLGRLLDQGDVSHVPNGELRRCVSWFKSPLPQQKRPGFCRAFLIQCFQREELPQRLA